MRESPVEAELRAQFAVVIGASAGGLEALTTLLSALPAGFPAAIVIVQHRTPDKPSLLEPILARRTRLTVTTAREKEVLAPGVVYVAAPDQHLTVGADRRLAYHDGTRIRGVRSSANPLFESAAEAFGSRLIAVVLSGSGMDATNGVQHVKARGGTVIVQDRATAGHFGMPGSAILTGAVDHVLPIGEIAAVLVDTVAASTGGVH
jgi:two-component system chemotaxis response regulator CheB